MCIIKLKRWIDRMLGKANAPVSLEPGQRKVALLFAINDYPGGGDLRGCINDLMHFQDILIASYPGFEIRAWVDAEVTRERFIVEVAREIFKMKAGDVLVVHYSGHGTQVPDRSGDEEDKYDEALYLYDGVVIDDDISHALKAIPEGATVVLFFDSCYSGTVTRSHSTEDVRFSKARFKPYSGLPIKKKKNVRFGTDHNWLVFSGCREYELSNDCFIKEVAEHRGLFTYTLLRALETSMTYQEWFELLTEKIPGDAFEQHPTLEGRETLKTKIVFK